MRVRLSDEDLALLFTKLQDQNLGPKQLAPLIGMHTRTIIDWRRGKYTIPKDQLVKMADIISLDLSELNFAVLDQWWHTARAGKKGSLVRFNKHGFLGTSESRRLGGINSYASRKSEINGIFTPNSIHKPSKSRLFAELIGILIGDGGVTQYQVVVATNSVDDYEYSLFVAQLFEKLFGIRPSLTKRKNINCITVVISSVELVRFLKLSGVCQGHKLKQNLDIPAWVMENSNYAKACLRGIFDTDGCIFQERHRIKGKLYCYPRLSFVSMSSYLRISIAKILADLEFSPKIRNNRSVNLESRSDIERYFKVIGTSNPKHLKRFRSFGGVG